MNSLEFKKKKKIITCKQQGFYPEFLGIQYNADKQAAIKFLGTQLHANNQFLKECLYLLLQF